MAYEKEDDIIAGSVDQNNTLFSGNITANAISVAVDPSTAAIQQLLEHIGEDIYRGGLLETPKRVLKAWSDWTSGYSVDPASVLKVFEDGAENYDQMIVVKDIPFYSHCEHHMAPFFGTATIAYIPDGKIVGLSKLSRLLDVFAKRLQVQERLTAQVADSLIEHLDAKGAGVVIKARHMCMESRGVCKQGHHTVTSALRGVIKDEADTRAEFLSLAHQ
jgi:GTP cyclohydrolase I